MAALAHSDVRSSEIPTGGRLYRILTEYKNVADIKNWLVSQGIDYTIFKCDGTWRGSRESSIAIELAGVSRPDAEWIALAIKTMNNQEAVLLQEIPVQSILL